MPARPRVFEYAVELDDGWNATSDRGGATLSGGEPEQWTPEHLVLVGLTRCVLTSLGYHAGRAGLEAMSSGTARGTVTRREEDGRFAFVALEAHLHVRVTPLPDAEALAELLAKAERDCFVGASLRARPIYHWTVDGEEA